MKCAKVEQIIINDNITNIKQLENSKYKKHVFECKSCMKAIDEMNEYNDSLSELHTPLKDVPSTMELTDFLHTPANKNNIGNSRNLLNTMLRVASVLIIVISCSLFLQQKHYINESLACLNIQYHTPEPNQEFIEEYNKCIDDSERELEKIIRNDKTLMAALTNTSYKQISSTLNQHAKNACHITNLAILNESTEARLKILQNLLKGGIN